MRNCKNLRYFYESPNTTILNRKKDTVKYPMAIQRYNITVSVCRIFSSNRPIVIILITILSGSLKSQHQRLMSPRKEVVLLTEDN